jgi:hypothetical protein
MEAHLVTRSILTLMLLASSHAGWSTTETRSGLCAFLLKIILRQHREIPVPDWRRNLYTLGNFESAGLRVFDRHLVARIEVLLSELDPKQRTKFLSMMGLISFNPNRTYGGLYSRVLGQAGIEFDPNLQGHPMSRLVYIHELRHLSDDIKAGFPPEGLDLDIRKTELAALGEGYDYMALVNNDLEFRIEQFPKHDIPVERNAGEKDGAWAKRHYDDHFGVDLYAVRKLSREEYLDRTIRAYDERIRAQEHRDNNSDFYSLIAKMKWGTFFKDPDDSRNESSSKTPGHE